MIRIENLNFGYRQHPFLFRDFSLALEPGHIHGLLGRNGTGKTTLLKLISGLLFPKEGTINVLEQKPALRRPSLYRDLFFIPEEFSLPPISFDRFANVTAPLYPNFSSEALDYYAAAFQVNRTGRLDHTSMGQRKIAYIAFAMACQTPVLIMDEPTNGLDIPAKSVFRRLLSGFADSDRCILISSHQVRDIENLIDRVTVIDGEGLLYNKSVEEIARRLSFGQLGPDETPLYSEEKLGGIYGVTENKRGEEQKVNLEMLFNASVTNREAVIRILNDKNDDDE